MEKQNKKQSIRLGVVLTLIWLLIASLLLFVAAATSGNGNTTNSEFTWSWSTNNSGTGAAGSFNGELVNERLSLNISSTSSIYVEEKKD